MSYEFHTDLETLSSKLTQSLHGELKRTIQAKLQVEADRIIERIAQDMASKLHGIIKSYRTFEGNAIHVHLVIDGVEKATAILKDPK